MKTEKFAPKRMLLALLSAGVIGAAGVGISQGLHADAATPAPVVAAAPVAAPAPAARVDFSQIVAQHGAAVVNVTVSGISRAASEESDDAPATPRRGQPRIDPNDPLFEFFKRFQGPNGGGPSQGEMPMHGRGSGFIVTPDGVILTNAHVVRGAKEVIVKLIDRREFKAKVLGSDSKTDIAVLKIDANNLPVVLMGNSRNLLVGEPVLAIGSPFGFENSATVGVVSGKGRVLPDDSFVPFIQTDAAINPGNSGGPLFNARGEVIGINSQIFSHTGGYQGLAFAIPIDVAVKVKDQIVATGKATHARLGVSIQEVNQSLADSFKLDRPEGALVGNVEPGGAGAAAGLKTGDVIRKVNEQPIVSASDLPGVIGLATPGEKVTIEIWRDGKQQEVVAKLGDASEKAAKAAKTDDAVEHGKLGLALRPLQPQEKRDAGVESGLLVENVGGVAATAGVQAGDILVAVNGTAVTTVDQVREVVAKSKKSVALLIQRDGNKIFVPLSIG
jgi:serine protease Do